MKKNIYRAFYEIYFFRSKNEVQISKNSEAIKFMNAYKMFQKFGILQYLKNKLKNKFAAPCVMCL